MVCAPEMLGNCYRSTNALMPLAADAARLLTAHFLARITGKGRGSIFAEVPYNHMGMQGALQLDLHEGG